jgi:hypothetical protein
MSGSDPAADPLGALARSLDRPRESLSAFAALTPDQLELLTTAIEETHHRRQREIEQALQRSLPRLLSPAVARTLRGRPELDWLRRRALSKPEDGSKS